MYTALVAVALIIAAFLSALAALLVFASLDRRKSSRLRQFSEEERDSVVFIFENTTLLDATPAARQLLATSPRKGTAWAHFAELLGPHFPRLSDRMKDLADLGLLELRSTDGSSRIHAEWHDGVARIRLDLETDDNPTSEIDRHSILAMSKEIESLRAIAEHTPYALWRQTATGTITWCNTAYLSLAESLFPSDEANSWPPTLLFDMSPDTWQDNHAKGPRDLPRIALTPKMGGEQHWFDVGLSMLPSGDLFGFALPADRLVKAETTLDEFVATLTKTFAALPIGMAIFNRSREMTLFNPALMDLTMLPADFLISRPTLSSFLDRLREARMMPEPRDYKSWRQQMSDLVAAAEKGFYEETWSLPTGQTYRVSGRPHPDGAVALLFEDISAEITVSRRYRAEIEAGQAVLDALPQAVAVFTSAGVLSLSNAAYARIWGRDPSTTLVEISLSDAVKLWQEACAPSAVWEHLRAFALQSGPRSGWAAPITRLDGRTLLCSVSPVAGGGTMVAFVPEEGRSAVSGDISFSPVVMPGVAAQI